jgi:hypothetical protein
MIELTLGESLSCTLDTISSSDSGSKSRKSGDNVRLHRTTMWKTRQQSQLAKPKEGLIE